MILAKEIRKQDDSGFATEQALISQLTRKEVNDKYLTISVPNVGWVGRLKPEVEIDPDHEIIDNSLNLKPKFAPSESPSESEPVKDKKPGPSRYRVRVFRASEDEENKNVPISVTANSPQGRTRFQPGEEVILTKVQINILKDSVFSPVIAIPPESGIYRAGTIEQCLNLAQSYYPDFKPRWDTASNQIMCEKYEPKYNIVFLDQNPTPV